MQDNNNAKEETPIISAAMPDENTKNKHIESKKQDKSRTAKKTPMIIGIIAGIVFVVVAGVLIAVGIMNQGEQISEYEYSIQRDPETGERPLFGTDPNKDNSGAAYVKFQQRIINAADTTDAERFDAYISIAVYYNAVEEYDKAISTMQSINVNRLSDNQLERYYDVFANIYESKGDTEKAAEYRNLADESASSGQSESTEQQTETTTE